jgi:hypothetical protein
VKRIVVTTRAWFCFLVYWLCVLWFGVPASSGFEVQALPGQQDQLAGSKCELKIRWLGAPPSGHWKWRLIASERTLAVGRSQLVHDVQNEEPSIYGLAFETPNLNPGVSLKATLSVDSNEEKQLLALPITIWHPDPFIASDFEGVAITFFDPAGIMKDHLQGLSLRGQFVNRLADVGNADVIVVAEDAPWNENLSESLGNWVRSGRKVLMLRGSSSSVLRLNWSNQEIKSMRFGQLTDRPWSAQGTDPDYWRKESLRSALQIDISKRGPSLTIVDTSPVVDADLAHWQIAEFQSRSGGVCLFLGITILDHWNSSASPRLLFKQFLESTKSQSNAHSR